MMHEIRVSVYLKLTERNLRYDSSTLRYVTLREDVTQFSPVLLNIQVYSFYSR